MNNQLTKAEREHLAKVNWLNARIKEVMNAKG